MANAPLNGIKLNDLAAYTEIVTNEPAQAISEYGIVAEWKGGVHSEIRTLNQKVGGKEIVKDFRFQVGEPEELLGNNAYPTPQDYLLGGMAGCMMVGFVAGASARGIKLDSVNLTIKGNLDLRGFLDVSEEAPVGFDEIQFHFDVKGDATQAEFDEVIAGVQKLSPNYRTIADAVKVTAMKA
ncbi:OsmC family protein [Vibrio sagamiensis]|uniref:Osmotically inducible protein C n=1 Tax=Vibrio sagamiensis NBRC 104589 TaxID=1219064 RepID=A0A511QK87_9VIBR|nr:OsmC family protein [Vibrio sagamiensis]PNQ54381.1 OsmC family peroxiredoxin [Vibrio agarivorans]GEM77734.1 osmotically inducible protein C [Vibrio sagamiensis NBRC 104589]